MSSLSNKLKLKASPPSLFFEYSGLPSVWAYQQMDDVETMKSNNIIFLNSTDIDRIIEMAWKDVSSMSQQEEFVVLASIEGANLSELCRRFGVSRMTGYKWLARDVADGVAGLADQSRRPLKPSGQTSPGLEQRVLALRREHPAWGSRKRRRRLRT